MSQDEVNRFLVAIENPKHGDGAQGRKAQLLVAMSRRSGSSSEATGRESTISEL
jgi:hypothetical protein